MLRMPAAADLAGETRFERGPPKAVFSSLDSTTIDENVGMGNSTRENQTDSTEANDFVSIRFAVAASSLENVTIQNGVAIERGTPVGLGKMEKPEGFNSTFADWELREIFNKTGHDTSGVGTMEEVQKELKSHVNCTCEENSLNDTAICNETMMALQSGFMTEYPSFIGTVDVVAVAAGLCLILAVAGYFSCVGYRRYHERKYGNSQMVAREDVYDTTDLKYFEI